ncbi:hypothetical protein FSP39_024289 [Pinctada imbricata]|uniref:Zinc finger CCHC domain-containing protein 7 n=1 Tax=Pinctada imbricata TaxID=66713 RepID=A0AA89BS29_PINIB|nr:hypothetical protein FSP39_024289 [Pinctada imbricata]
MISPHCNSDAESDVNSDEDDSDEARKEIEIALYSQIHYEAEDCAEGQVEQNFADLSYEFQVYRASSNATKEKKVDEGLRNSAQKQSVIVIKDKSDMHGKRELIDCDKPHSCDDGKKVQHHNWSLNFIALDESIDCKLGAPHDEVVILSGDECDVNDPIEVSSESVESGEYLWSSEDDFDSDCMMLDESMSENEEIQVNVDDHHQKLLKKRSKAEIEKWKILDVDRFGEAPVHTTNRYYGNRFMRCNNCRDLGHHADDCPKPQIDKDTPLRGDNEENPRVFCCNCGQDGHFGYECEEDWMDRHSPATYPLVARYDHTVHFQRVSRKRKRDTNNSGTVKELEHSKLKVYCNGMNRIVHSLENSQDLEPVIKNPKKKKKQKRKRQKEKVNEMTNNCHESEGQVQKTGGKKKKKKNSKASNNHEVKSSASNNKNFKNPADYFPRTKLPAGTGINSREVNHQAFNNEWWFKGKGGKKSGNNIIGQNNINRGFRTKIQK